MLRRCVVGSGWSSFWWTCWNRWAGVSGAIGAGYTCAACCWMANGSPSGLQAVADGIAGSGASLAALALKLRDAAPDQDKAAVTRAALDHLADRSDLSQLMALRPAIGK